MEKKNFKSFTLITLIVGQLQTNCYLLIDRKTQKTLIIDPGDDADYIERVIVDFNAKPTLIVATHGHFDHIIAAFELQMVYSIPFLIHKGDEFLVKDLRARTKHWLKVASPPPPKIDSFMKEDDIIQIGSLRFKVFETPGHTPGGISLYCEKEKILFIGDLFFADGSVGRTDFSYSSKEKLKESIEKIKKLPRQTIVFPGHGESLIRFGLD